MAYNVEILPTDWEDLKSIEDWYLVQFGVETALKVSDHILDSTLYSNNRTFREIC